MPGVNERPDSNVFVFRLDLQGLTPRLNELIGSVELLGDDGETVEAFIEAPFMNDSIDENYSENLYYEIKANADGSYQLFLTVDQEYLDTAEYPVEIDPTTTWGTDPVIYDAYVIKGSTYGDTNFFSDSVSLQCTGNASQGIMRQYMMMLDFYVILKGYCVTSVKLHLYESGAYTAGNRIQVRYPTTPWSLYTLTWNNQPSCSAPIATATTVGKLNSEVVLDITAYVRGLAAGTLRNYGIMYHNVNESSGFNKFYGARNSVASKRPKLVVNYVDGPTAPTTVSISSSCVKPGENVTLNWSGITTSYLEYVQYRITDSNGTNIVSYSNYKINIRGVDTGGIIGGEKGANFIVDSSIPSLPNPTLSPATSETNYSGSLPTITWTVSDNNFKDIYYTMNNGDTWILLSTSKCGSVTLPESSFPISGKYKINLRAYDKAGNYGTSGSVYYYYDATAPEGLTGSINNAGIEVKGSTKTPTLSWSVTDITLKAVEYSINGSSYVFAGTTASGTITLASSYFPTDGEYTIELRAVDSLGHYCDPVELRYVVDTVAPTTSNLTISKSDTGIRAYVRDVVSEDWDHTVVYYAVVPVGKDAPERTAYAQAASINYENDALMIDIPLSETFVSEGAYLVYTALQDDVGNIGYSRPAVKSWYNINAIYDGLLVADATQKVNESE